MMDDLDWDMNDFRIQPWENYIQKCAFTRSGYDIKKPSMKAVCYQVSEAYVSHGSTRETLSTSNLLIRCSQRTMLLYLDDVLYKQWRDSL
jgi:hypothetical protein